MMTDTHMFDRTQEHAKIMRYAGRQALAFLTRIDEGLSIVVQLWIASQDHQLRVAIGVDGADDEVISGAFADLDDESLASCLDQLGVAAMIADLETSL